MRFLEEPTGAQTEDFLFRNDRSWKNLIIRFLQRGSLKINKCTSCVFFFPVTGTYECTTQRDLQDNICPLLSPWTKLSGFLESLNE